MDSVDLHPPRRADTRVIAFGLRLLTVFGGGGAAVALVIALIAGVTSNVSSVVPSVNQDEVLLAPLAVRSIIYDSAGNEMAYLYAEQDRQEVELSEVPEELKLAVLGTEDADFYHHNGVSVRALARAFSANVESGATGQGGSTITQQLAKISLGNTDKTLKRKAQDAVLALRLEEQMTKDQILERYLNTVYLGHGAYGVQAAAETYFNASVGDLGWSESILLAGMIQSPYRYDPTREIGHERALKRREVVVGQLRSKGIITAEIAEEVLSTPIATEVFERRASGESDQLVGGGYFSEQVKQQLLSMPELGETRQDRYNAVFSGGLRVYATYDPKAQRMAEEAVKEVPDSKGKYFTGLVSLDPGTSAVRAMVGGPDFETSQFNYVTQAWRQPGSTFKYFVLVAALERGYVPNDIISGVSPCRFPDPSAPGGIAKISGGGKTASLTSQTQSSSNCGFVRLGQVVGLDIVSEVAARMGITTIDADFNEVPITENPPINLPLGTREVHAVDMAAAYGAAENDGVYHAPYYIDRITDARGEVLYEHLDPGSRVMSSDTAKLVTEILAKNVTGGTGRRAAIKGQVSAGKTGTTQNNADAWFIGYTPYAVTAVWLGNPTSQDDIVINGRRIQGADYPSRVWGAFNTAYHQDLESRAFPEAPDTRSGKSIKYRNKYDDGQPKVAATTTTVPGEAPADPGAAATPAASAPDAN